MQAKCCVYSTCCVFGLKTETRCQFHHLSNTRQRFSAVEVRVLIEGRDQRAGPPPLFVPTKIILFSTSVWLVGYSEVRRRLSSSLLRWILAKLPGKQPQIEKHRVLCVSWQGQFSRTIPEPQLPQNQTYMESDWLLWWSWAAHRVLATLHKIIELFCWRRRKSLQSST